MTETHIHNELRRMAWACAETGNLNNLETILVEYAEYSPSGSEDIRNQILEAFGELN